MLVGRLFGLWILLVALAISTVAAYYSIVGLTAIFAAAVIPVIIMGVALEVGKVTTAVWLHVYWNTAPRLMKFYLTLATVMLMFITSMGIFGFLSRAHIEQTAVATEGFAQIEAIDENIARYESSIVRFEQQIVTIQTRADQQDTGIQDKIDAEQQRIDSAYSRIQPAIDEQNEIVKQEQSKGNDEQELNIQAELDRVNIKIDELATLQRTNDARALQALVGATVDGKIGRQTRAAIEVYKQGLNNEKAALQSRLNRIIENAEEVDQTIIDNARAEIKRLRDNAEQEIANSLALIDRLREGVSVNTDNDIQADIDAQYVKIDEARNIIDELRNEKFALEKEARKLEAEVGPVKYLADLIYGEQADRNTLEEAVRWVILILVAVFDPLAVILVLAGVSTIDKYRLRKKEIIEPVQTVVKELDEPKRKLQKETTVPTSSNADVTLEETVEAHTNTTPEVEQLEIPDRFSQIGESMSIQEHPVVKFEDVDQELIDNEFNHEENQTTITKPTKAIKSITVKKIQ